nr:MAG TPA: hypothetical protein [Caudoviricetes sp.]
MTFVKLLRNPVLSEIQVLREQVLCEPVFLRVQYYSITLLMSLRHCSGFVLVRVCSGFRFCPGLAGVRASKRCHRT